MDTMEIDLSGKVAVVTGGSRGVGKAVAGALGFKGAKVAICGRKKENLDQAAEEMRKNGMEVFAGTAHVGRSNEVADFFGAVEERFGRLDIVVNNVGMNVLTPSVAEAEESLWDKILDINLKSAFLVSGHAVRIMSRTGGGKIINVSSTAASKAARGMGIYCVAKAGLEMLTRVLAAELAQSRINVNAVAPGMVKTELSRPLWSNEGLLKEIVNTIPMGRIAETDDVVGAILFLSSGMSDYITGEIIVIDGGSMA